MGPLPKRRYPKARQGKRRSHLSLTSPAVEACPRCHKMKLCHRICPTCGSYGGEEIIKTKLKK
ncbi:MAG: 50S ribosomal protein L32 [Dehalococcoidia bacterium]|nr:50S ribosomal protein L32 [Dehalococcoidia bacterium]